MIPVTFERKRSLDEWEEALNPLFSKYTSKFEADYDSDYLIKVRNDKIKIYKTEIEIRI